MRSLVLLTVMLTYGLTGCTQNNSASKANVTVGGSCEGCEAIYECPADLNTLNNLCWLPDWNDAGTKLAVNGVVYDIEGKPAAGVVIYIYHTDQKGVYPKKGDEKGWGKRHGYLRGWMKTNEKGEYKFFTLKPAAYPGRKDPAHIHVTIKEPDKNEYWIDDFLFEDDPLLIPEMRKRSENRGGDGILKTKDVGNMLKAERNIYLGKNIPDYPKQ